MLGDIFGVPDWASKWKNDAQSLGFRQWMNNPMGGTANTLNQAGLQPSTTPMPQAPMKPATAGPALPNPAADFINNQNQRNQMIYNKAMTGASGNPMIYDRQANKGVDMRFTNERKVGQTEFGQFNQYVT